MTAMKHILTILTLCLCYVYGMKAQGLKQQGTAADNIVPEGWTHTEAVGDVDKDGLNDLVIAATPNFKENMKQCQSQPRDNQPGHREDYH